MKYVDEFRSRRLIGKLRKKIAAVRPCTPVTLMEVCGTHTQNFRRFGLAHFLPESVRLISGPGCPVCVSPQIYIDRAVALAGMKDTAILSFGDMLRVPGTSSSLAKEKSRGADVRVLYSPFDAIAAARKEPGKKMVFLGVGFETTAAAVALTVAEAKRQKIQNLFFLVSLKLIPPAMEFLLKDPQVKLDGFLCPGHVSAIIGAKAYERIARRYHIPCCVAGFEPVDILEGMYMLLRQVAGRRAEAENAYTRVVTREGNVRARALIAKVFCVRDVEWRGLGLIAKSGLALRREFGAFDAERQLAGARSTSARGARPPSNVHLKKCRCGEVLRGLISPPLCPLFKKRCAPENPFGPCMVSTEGACNVYYRYEKNV